MAMEMSATIWPAMYKALGVEYREATEITGSSGLTHQVQAIGVDEKTDRVVIVSSEYNPRIAALMQVDIQATLPSAKVLVARPIAFNIAHALQQVLQTASGQLDIVKLGESLELMTSGDSKNERLTEMYGPALGKVLDNASKIKLPPLSYIIDGLQQISILDWKALATSGDLPMQKVFDAANILMNYDNLQGDRTNGICPLPTYEFSEADWDLMLTGRDIDAVQQRLKDYNIYQYFFPPADTVALGLIEKHLGSADIIGRSLEVASEKGHIISGNAIVPDASSIHELLEELKSGGYSAEFEHEMHLTAEGESVRQALKVRPSESFMEKLSKIISFKVDITLKDLKEMLGR